MKSKREIALSDLCKMVSRFAKRVAPVYSLLGWTWYDEQRVTEKDIKNFLLEALDDLKNNKNKVEISSGGLSVGWDSESCKGYLSFTLSEHVYPGTTTREMTT